MAKWAPLPTEKLFSQPDQQAFLQARRMRLCKICKNSYSVNSDNNLCPTCQSKGIRAFDRLTIIAGRRWGKSRIGSLAGVEEAIIPNTIGWCCAPTNPKLHRYVIPAFQQLIPPEWVDSWSSEFNDLRLKNGSLIHFQTLEDPDQGRGQGLDWLWIDEVCELTRNHWEVIRPSLAGDTTAFFTTSPRSYDWVYEELYRPAEAGLPGFWACHAKTITSANPRISQDFLDREKASMSELMYRQEYEADFVTFTGAIYGGYIRESHILRTEERVKELIPSWPDLSSYQVLVGIDTGADHPFGAVKMVSTEKGMVVVGEYLERAKSFIAHASAMKRLAGNPRTKWAINKNEKQPMIELAQHGISATLAANDQIAGIERVKSWLHANQLYFVEPLARETLRQMQAYRWAENVSPTDGSTRKERVYKLDDELPDCIRYALMSWPTLPKAAPVETTRDLTKLDPEIRVSIERMRRIDNPKTEPEDMTGDFWV